MGLLFFYSGVSKFASITNFRYSVVSLKLFSFELTEIITYAIPSIEIILGSLLIIGLFIRFAAIHLNVLMLGFTYISFHALQLNLGECNCLGGFVAMKYDSSHFILLFILFTLNVFIALNKTNFWAADNIIFKKKKE